MCSVFILIWSFSVMFCLFLLRRFFVCGFGMCLLFLYGLMCLWRWWCSGRAGSFSDSPVGRRCFQGYTYLLWFDLSLILDGFWPSQRRQKRFRSSKESQNRFPKRKR